MSRDEPSSTSSTTDPAAHDGKTYDVVVVGGGNAGFCAAHAAREQNSDRVTPSSSRRPAGGAIRS